eukprot:1653807-Rhodomonas_salina.2
MRLRFSLADSALCVRRHNEDEPWGAFLQGPGNPAGPRLSNPQGHTTWVPVDNESWPNYNVHGYGTY